MTYFLSVPWQLPPLYAFLQNTVCVCPVYSCTRTEKEVLNEHQDTDIEWDDESYRGVMRTLHRKCVLIWKECSRKY